MDIYGFIDEVADEVEKNMGSEYAIRTVENRKNNGIVLHGLSISEQNVNLRPCIYLDGCFETYRKGEMEMADIADMVIRKYRESAVHEKWDASIFTNYGRVKGFIRARLVNTEKNGELLREVPHREFLDLSLVYSADYSCGDADGATSIRITKEHMRMWGVDEETLYRQAKVNMEENKEYSLDGLTELVSVISEGRCQLDDAGEIPMYVLSNQRKVNGAVQMLNPHAMEMAAEILGTEIVILPSSVHEVILLAAGDDGAEDINQLAAMVSEINGTVVSAADFLSNHVYRYSHGTGEITMAA